MYTGRTLLWQFLTTRWKIVSPESWATCRYISSILQYNFWWILIVNLTGFYTIKLSFRLYCGKSESGSDCWSNLDDWDFLRVKSRCQRSGETVMPEDCVWPWASATAMIFFYYFPAVEGENKPWVAAVFLTHIDGQLTRCVNRQSRSRCLLYSSGGNIADAE